MKHKPVGEVRLKSSAIHRSILHGTTLGDSLGPSALAPFSLRMKKKKTKEKGFDDDRMQHGHNNARRDATTTGPTCSDKCDSQTAPVIISMPPTPAEKSARDSLLEGRGERRGGERDRDRDGAGGGGGGG